MVKANTTETAVDKQLKLKEVQLEINKFKGIKEKAKNEVDVMVESLADLSKRKKELEEIVALPYTDLAKFIETAGRIVNESSLAMNASLNIVEGFSKLIDKLSDRIEDQKKELDAVEKKKQEALALITAEEERLSNVKSDLNIYRGRLQKKIDLYGLSDEIEIVI